ncbi:MAG: nuclear transport factor 2 family protein [Minicystis sp.]
MAERSRASAFIDALHHAESQGDIGPLVGMFAPEAELENPALHKPLRGPEGAREFWKVYVGTFREIHSEFRLVVETEQAAALEWTSRGSAPDGRELVYDGVTLLVFEGDEIRRFRAYFDPRSLGAQLECRSVQAA